MAAPRASRTLNRCRAETQYTQRQCSTDNGCSSITQASQQKSMLSNLHAIESHLYMTGNSRSLSSTCVASEQCYKSHRVSMR